ncbi:MAG: hypothetical protein LBP78_01540 [Acidaminococcales bacterium]|jgi:hypothetical protein|nr:hypothetical protein [Acidaminococcales bacterium]
MDIESWGMDTETMRELRRLRSAVIEQGEHIEYLEALLKENGVKFQEFLDENF